MAGYARTVLSSVVFSLLLWLARAKADDGKDPGVYISKVGVQSEGLGKPGYATIVVDAPLTTTIEIVWSDASTWLPADGHPNYTISTTSQVENGRALHRSSVRIREMLSEYVSADFDFYYLPVSVDVRAGDGYMLYQETFKIPINPYKSEHTRDNFDVVEIPPPTVNFKNGSQVTLRWVFVTRDENEFTVWRTMMRGRNVFQDLDYTDEMLYTEDFIDSYSNGAVKPEHIQVNKNVELVGKKYRITLSVTLSPSGKGDGALYVLYLRSRNDISWEDTINLRLSTRLLYDDNTSLMGDDVAVALSYCDGAYLEATKNPYVGLQRGLENCIKCETYGNAALRLDFLKNGKVLKSTKHNSLVHSSYYPETMISMYTFREEDRGDEGVYSCRAMTEDGREIQRDFYVRWIERLMMSSQLKLWNSTQAQISCAAFADPLPELTFWRCQGDSECNLTKIETNSKFQVTIAPQLKKFIIVGELDVFAPATEMKEKAIMCRAQNDFHAEERWTVFAEWLPNDVTHENEAETEQEGGYVTATSDDEEDGKTEKE